MKKFALTLLFAVCLLFAGNAQDYRTGIGFRAGFSSGLTVKHFVTPKGALEGILSSRWGGLEITGLYEIHNRAFDTDRLNWYFGFGAHIGFWNGKKVPWSETDDQYTVVGVDGILGLEYNFEEVPINLSIDWKPELNFYGYEGFWADGGALSIRYIF